MADFKLSLNQIEKLCVAGSMAPSGGNAQPWKIRVRNNLFEITVNKQRLSGFLDIGGLASIFGLGCFTENVVLEAKKMGLDYSLEIREGQDVSDFLVKIFFTENGSSKKPNLADFIDQRITNRKISDGRLIEEKNINYLKNLIIESDFKLSTISSNKEKQGLSNILSVADGIRMSEQRTLKEMMEELRWSEIEAEKTADGIDLKTLELPGNAAWMFALLKNHPFLGKLIPQDVLRQVAKPLILGCSHIGCVSISGPLTQKNMFLAGRVCERIWLGATKLKIAFQPWTPLIYFLIRTKYFQGKDFTKQQIKDIDKSGENLKRIFNLSKQFPVFLFRLSYAKPPISRSLRVKWQQFTQVLN